MKKNIVMYMGGNLRGVVQKIDERYFENLREIRIREGKALIFFSDKEMFFNYEGKRCEKENAFKPTARDIALTAEILGGYSLYAFDEEIKNGFITVEGGHRVGVCGRCVSKENGINTIRNISSLNFRIAREVKGCGQKVFEHIFENGEVLSTLIVSPPGGGKTTILRDLIRLISESGINVGVCDERSEIGASVKGRILNDLGERTDVLDACPKQWGIEMLIRSMSPRVIAVDEIGAEGDVLAIEKAKLCAVELICTAHGRSLEDVKRFEGIFDRFVFLEDFRNVGKVRKIYDRCFKELT